MDVHPVIFEPLLKPRPWGGRRLETLLGKRLPPEGTIGESWEVADLEGEQSVVRDGPARGLTLGELVRRWGPKLLGPAKLVDGHFPLLLKYLDARESLSVQVHPDAETARRLGGTARVKHEAWYVIHAEPGACIYRGFKPGVSREDVRRALQDGGVEDLLVCVPARPGRCYYLPSGTVHALGGGILVAEIQTPSDMTYRLFDWGRVDPATGRPRELAIEQGLACASFEPFDFGPERRSHVASVWTTVARLITCPSFIVERVRFVAGLNQVIPFSQLVVWMVREGSGRVFASPRAEPCEFRKGDTVVLPAGMEEPRLETDEDCVWLEVTVPQASAECGVSGYGTLRRDERSAE